MIPFLLVALAVVSNSCSNSRIMVTYSFSSISIYLESHLIPWRLVRAQLSIGGSNDQYLVPLLTSLCFVMAITSHNRAPTLTPGLWVRAIRFVD